MTMAPFARRLAMLAYRYGVLTPVDAEGRHALWALLREQAAGEAPKIGGPGSLRRSTLDGWFGEGRKPQSDNLDRLERILHEYAHGHGEEFDPEWLGLPEEALSDALEISESAFEDALEAAVSAAPVTTVSLPFAIPQDRAIRVREKYAGQYHIYRFHAAKPEILREVLIFSPRTQQGIGEVALVDHRGLQHRGVVIPTHDSLTIHLYEGAGGDGFSAETIIMRRKKDAYTAYAAMRVKLSESAEFPMAARSLVVRLDKEKYAFPLDEQTLEKARAEVASLPLEEAEVGGHALVDWLSVTARETGRDGGLGEHVLIMDADQVMTTFDGPKD